MRTILLIVSVLVLASCRYKQASEPAPAVNTFEVGDKFRVTLPENHEKKESWCVIEDFDNNVVTRLNDVWHGNDKGIDMNFLATGSGTVKLTFIMRTYRDTVDKAHYLIKITDN